MPGDEELRFEQVARDLSPLLLRYFRLRAGDAADDLTQEALLRIQRGLPGFDGRSSMKTWAMAIARRVAADHFRRRRPAEASVTVEDAIDPAPGGEGLLAARQMSQCVRDQLDTLAPGDRRILLLHDVEDAGMAAVAKDCGCSDGTARVRLHRARKRLRQALVDHCEFYRETDNVLRCCRKQEDK
ncbi:MAG: RNA polymerase sigma factor [Pseudomonadota bacterium]